MDDGDAGELVGATDHDGQERRARAVDAGARWSAAVLLQIERAVDVGGVLIEQHRQRPWSQADWDEDAYRLPWYRLEADRHFLLVAANNLVRSTDFLDAPAYVDTSGLDGVRRLGPMIKTLRDCNEHWNEEVREWVKKPSPLTGRAFKELAQFGPEADIQSHQWTASGAVTVAGVLALAELRRAAEEARAFYRALAAGWFITDGWAAI